MKNARGLLLDLDGTLADTMTMLYGIYERFLAEHDKVGSPAEFRTLVGPPLDEAVAMLAARHGIDEPGTRLVARYVALVREAYLDAPPMPGALALLEGAAAAGFRSVVVTSNAEALARGWLERHSLSSLVFGLIDARSCSRGKPDPEPYLKALRVAECRADRSIAIEDSPAGARSAMGAGLRTYVLCSRPAIWSDWPAVAGFVSDLEAIIPKLGEG